MFSIFCFRLLDGGICNFCKSPCRKPPLTLHLKPIVAKPIPIQEDCMSELTLLSIGLKRAKEDIASLQIAHDLMKKSTTSMAMHSKLQRVVCKFMEEILYTFIIVKVTKQRRLKFFYKIFHLNYKVKIFHLIIKVKDSHLICFVIFTICSFQSSHIKSGMIPSNAYSR